jgi:hypothetical protein
MRDSHWRIPAGLLACLPILFAGGASIWIPGTARAGDEPPPRLLYVFREGDTVVASNVLFGRSDELELTARETVVRQEEDSAVVVLETNQRLIAYSVYTAGWVAVELRAGEKVERLEAEDFSAFALTDRRILNFNGRNGNWSQTSR